MYLSTKMRPDIWRGAYHKHHVNISCNQVNIYMYTERTTNVRIIIYAPLHPLQFTKETSWIHEQLVEI